MADKFEFVFLPIGHENVENRELYATSGFHPVLLGDLLNDGRYRIVHKLGFGGFGTVWLARDNKEARYVSIKILTAFTSKDSRELGIQRYLRTLNDSDHPGRQCVSTLVNDFTLDGPNGQHLCLVYDALGPSIAGLRSEYGEAYMKIRPDVARQLARQVSEALDFLHKSGLTYGDLSASNTLIELSAVHDLSEEEICQHFGAPVEEEMQLCDGGGPLPPSAPRVVYAPLEWSQAPLQYLTPRIKLIDFGNTFLSGDPPSDSEIGFNNSYAAPEVLAGSRPALASNIWALACVIFEIRSGRQLISQGYFGSKDSALYDIKEALGLLPALQRETQTIERGSHEVAQPEVVTGESGGINDGEAMAKSQQEETGTAPKAKSSGGQCKQEAGFLRGRFYLGWTLVRWLRQQWKKTTVSRAVQETPIDVPQSGCDPAGEYRARGLPPTADNTPADRSLRQRILDIGKPEAWQENGPQEGNFPKPLIGEEAEDLEDLLASMLTYDAAERMTLDQVFAHRWFWKIYSPDVEGDWLQRWS